MWQRDTGWQEAVISVGDLGRWIEAFAALGDWTVQHRGAADRRLLAHWQLGSGATAEEAVLRAPGDEPRWIRLVRFDGVARTTMRGGAQAWDTGGIFSLLIRTRAIETVLAKAYEIGWNSFNDIDVMRFSTHVNRNVVLRAPDGVCFGLYEAEKPAPGTQMFGMPFTAQMMVRDSRASRAFFVDNLGWGTWYDGEATLAINQFNMPANYAGRVPKNVVLAHARPEAYGQVEIVQWRIFTGRDLASRCRPPNRGHLAIRWAVDSDVAAAIRHRSEVLSGPTSVALAPFGEARLTTVSSPAGALIELIEA